MGRVRDVYSECDGESEGDMCEVECDGESEGDMCEVSDGESEGDMCEVRVMGRVRVTCVRLSVMGRVRGCV